MSFLSLFSSRKGDLVFVLLLLCSISYLFFPMLKMGHRTSYMPNKYSTTELHSQSLVFLVLILVLRRGLICSPG